MNNEILEQLKELALSRSIPFCYSCYKEAPTGCCKTCGSDDLMRLVPGVGCEYGADWVIKHILETDLTPVDLEESFENMMRECYPETTKFGWMEFDTVTLMKENDPIAWRCAVVEHESSEEADGVIVSLDGGSTYYYVNDIEKISCHLNK